MAGTSEVLTKYGTIVDVDPQTVVRIDPQLLSGQNNLLAVHDAYVRSEDTSSGFFKVIDIDEDPLSANFGTFRVQNIGSETADLSWVAYHWHTVQSKDPLVNTTVVQNNVGPRGSLNDPPAIVLFGGSGGGFYQAPELIYVAPGHPIAADDTDLNTPFITISGAMTAIGVPVDAADQLRQFTVWIEPGQYDEEVVTPAGRSLKLIGMGPVALGVVDNSGPTVTTPRNLTINADQALEQGGMRPTVEIIALARIEASTGQQARSTAFWITGNLFLEEEAASISTTDVALRGVKISRQFADDLILPKNGGTNIYMYHSFVDDDQATGTSVSIAGGRLQVIESTEFDNDVLVNLVGRFSFCEFGGDITATSGILFSLPPGGFFHCTFATGATYTAPAGDNLIVDSWTNYDIMDEAVIIAGGTDKRVLALPGCEYLRAIIDVATAIPAVAMNGAGSNVDYDTGTPVGTEGFINSSQGSMSDPDADGFVTILIAGRYVIHAKVNALNNDAASRVVETQIVRDPQTDGATPEGNVLDYSRATIAAGETAPLEVSSTIEVTLAQIGSGDAIIGHKAIASGATVVQDNNGPISAEMYIQRCGG